MIQFRLRVFQTAATELSFTKTAQALFISQPAVTNHIKELEQEYEISLFERRGNQLTLTPAGRVLLRYVNTIYDLHQAIVFELNQLKNVVKGQFHLGASSTVAQYVIPPVLSHFHQSFPEVQVDLMSGNTEQIEQALIAKKIDLGIVEGKAHDQPWVYDDYLSDELVVVARYGHPVDALSLPAFTQHAWVLREAGSGTLEIIEAALAHRGIPLESLPVSMRLGSTQSIKHYLLDSDCFGILPRRSLDCQLRINELKVISVDGWRVHRPFYFIHPPQVAGLPRMFMKFARQGIHNVL